MTLIQIRSEARMAWRAVRRRGAAGLAEALLIAVAVGSSGVIFSAADGFIFRRAPYPNADRLVVFQRTSPVGVIDALMPGEARVLRARTDLFGGWYAHTMGAVASFQTDGATESVRVQQLQPGLVEALGVTPMIGRPLLADDERLGAETGAIIAEDLARRIFSEPAAAIGQRLATQPPLVVVGVMPASFHFPTALEKIWTPLKANGDGIAPTMAVLAPGASIGAVTAAIDDMNRAAANSKSGPLGPLRAVALSSAERDPRAFTNSGAFSASDGSELFVMLFGAAICLAALVALNLAGLELASMLGRARALAVRRVLGATRWALLRATMFESAILTAFGSALGLAFAAWGSPRLAGALPAVLGQVLMNPVDFDSRALAFAAGVAAVTAILTALPAAWYVSRPSGGDDLRRHAASVTGSRRQVTFRQVLVAAQVGLSVMLLILAGLFVQGYAARLLRRGIDTDRLATIQITAPSTSATAAAVARMSEDVLERLKNHPEVESIARAARLLPIDQRSFSTSHLWVEGRAASAGPIRVAFTAVDENYFATVGQRLMSGRVPDPGEPAGRVVVDEAFARRYWPNGDALGARFSLGRESTPGTAAREIVGIVSAVAVRYAEAGEIYLAYEPLPPGGAPLNFIARLRSPRALGDLAAVARSAAGNLRVRAMAMDDRYKEIDGDTRLAAVVSAGFGALAWLVAFVGLYGLMTSLARGRTREISIRIAVGAPLGSVERLVMRAVLRAVLAGVAAGVVVSLAAVRGTAAHVFGVLPTDAATYVTVAAIMIVTAIAATWPPARRAARADPTVGLRSE